MRANQPMLPSKTYLRGIFRDILDQYGHKHWMVAHYTMGNPQAHISGLYRLYPDDIAADCAVSTNDAAEILSDLQLIGFLRREGAYLWVVDQIRYEYASKPIKPKDWKTKNIIRHLEHLPDIELKKQLLAEYPAFAEWLKTGLPGKGKKGVHKGASEGALEGASKGASEGVGIQVVVKGVSVDPELPTGNITTEGQSGPITTTSSEAEILAAMGGYQGGVQL